jgi:uncharacterized protein YndB with AHSA1/START domain
MIDVAHQINAVARKVGRRTLEAGEARTVVVSQNYRADIDDVWDACTKAERFPRWVLPISGDLRVGGRYQLEGNAGGTVETCDAPNGFTATWEFGGSTTWIELRLTALGDDETRFELEHIAHVDDETWANFGPGAVGVGWDLSLMGLATHLGSGDGVDPADAAAWTASDEGQDFMARAHAPGARRRSPPATTPPLPAPPRSAPSTPTPALHPPNSAT